MATLPSKDWGTFLRDEHYVHTRAPPSDPVGRQTNGLSAQGMTSWALDWMEKVSLFAGHLGMTVLIVENGVWERQGLPRRWALEVVPRETLWVWRLLLYLAAHEKARTRLEEYLALREQLVFAIQEYV
jgi:hypothetical protein